MEFSSQELSSMKISKQQQFLLSVLDKNYDIQYPGIQCERRELNILISGLLTYLSYIVGDSLHAFATKSLPRNISYKCSINRGRESVHSIFYQVLEAIS